MSCETQWWHYLDVWNVERGSSSPAWLIFNYIYFYSLTLLVFNSYRDPSEEISLLAYLSRIILFNPDTFIDISLIDLLLKITGSRHLNIFRIDCICIFHELASSPSAVFNTIMKLFFTYNVMFLISTNDVVNRN